MDAPYEGPSVETIAVAERLLSEAFAGAVRLGDSGAALGGNRRRSRVYRLRVLDGPSGIPPSVIAKRAHVSGGAYDPDVAEIPAWTLLNDWAGLMFLARIGGDGDSLGPTLYGGDRDAGLFVCEDLGDGIRLDHLLLGADPLAAEEGCVAYAAALGRLHARTMGRQAEFNRIRAGLGPGTEASGFYTYEWLAPAFRAAAGSLSLTVAAEVDRALARIAAAMRAPGPFLAYIQGDACPDNCLFIGSTPHLVDFEGGLFGHCLLDGVMGRLLFPTCWCVNRMPAALPLRMEAAYRAELARGCPEATDDVLFSRAVVEACAVRTLEFCEAFPLADLLEKDRAIVVSTARQRVLLRFDILARTIEEAGYLEALGAAVRAMALKLRSLWPEADVMPHYPAFRR